MVRFRRLSLVCLLFAPSLLAGDTGTIKGSFTVAGKTFKPDHVYALVVPHPFGFVFDRQAKAVHLFFSVGPRSRDQLLGSYPPGTSGTELQVLVGTDQDNTALLRTHSFDFNVQAPEGEPCTGGECYVSGGSYEPVFEKRSYDLSAKGLVAGTFRMKETLTTIDRKKIPVVVEIEFSAPIFGEVKAN